MYSMEHTSYVSITYSFRNKEKPKGWCYKLGVRVVTERSMGASGVLGRLHLILPWFHRYVHFVNLECTLLLFVLFLLVVFK